MRKRSLLIGTGLVVVILIGVGVAAFALAGGGLGETAAGDLKAGSGGPDATVVAMHDNTFDPATLQVPAGVPTAFELRNDGQANHNFTSTALGVRLASAAYPGTCRSSWMLSEARRGSRTLPP